MLGLGWVRVLQTPALLGIVSFLARSELKVSIVPSMHSTQHLPPQKVQPTQQLCSQIPPPQGFSFSYVKRCLSFESSSYCVYYLLSRCWQKQFPVRDINSCLIVFIRSQRSVTLSFPVLRSFIPGFGCIKKKNMSAPWRTFVLQEVT